MADTTKYRVKVILIIVGFSLLALFTSSCLFNQPPKPIISIVQGSPYGTAPLVITFDISKSYDPDGKIVSFTFDFGDGSTPIHGTDISTPIEHTYRTPGQYFARFSVTDDRGTTVSVKVFIAVYAPSK